MACLFDQHFVTTFNLLTQLISPPFLPLKGYESTGQALITALRMGVGNLLGLYLGGIIAEDYGQVALYRYAGVTVAVVFLLFLLVQIGKKKEI